jgi:hypothetical protein
MTEDARIVYRPRPDTTPEGELNALASVYRFLLERHTGKTPTDESLRPKREGGTDGTLTNDPNKQVASSRVKENASS